MIIIFFLIFLFFARWIFWIERERSEKIAMEKEKAADANFAKYNKTLPEQKITGVKDLDGPYKKVTVSDGSVTFSFEVPDQWLTELRNSGEVSMNTEELREFLGTNWTMSIRSGNASTGASGTYWDFTWDMLKDMSYEEMKSYYGKARKNLSPGFPNASVSGDSVIWYTDRNSYQIDFRILSAQDAKKYLGFDISKDKEAIPPLVYIPPNDHSKVVAIYAYEVFGDFELSFNHLIQTIKFE